MVNSRILSPRPAAKIIAQLIRSGALAASQAKIGPVNGLDQSLDACVSLGGARASPMTSSTRLKNLALHRWIPTVLLVLLAAGSNGVETAGNRRDRARYGGPYARFFHGQFRKHDIRSRRASSACCPCETDVALSRHPDARVRGALPNDVSRGAYPWHIKSERGWVSAAGDVILLLGKVHWRKSESGAPLVVVHH